MTGDPLPEKTAAGFEGQNAYTDLAVEMYGKLYFHQDRIGSTIRMTKENGQTIAWADYDEWGVVRSPMGHDMNMAGVDNAVGFTSYTYDVVLDVYFAQARMYNADNRRFMSVDPVKDSVNWYAYCENSPVVFVDPAGETPLWLDKIEASFNLKKTAYLQYKWLFTTYVSPITLALVESRISYSLYSVIHNRDAINSVSEQYGVPAEIIGGIIFKEQLTSVLPDFAANIDTYFDGKIIPRSTPTHSTGLGAIFPQTARAAWEFVDENMVMHLSNKDLQFKLSSDDEFNIKTIAAVLIYEARNRSLICESTQAKDLTIEQWREPVIKYNGNEEYMRKVYEYLDDIETLLR